VGKELVGTGPKQEAHDVLARVRNNISNCIPAEWIAKPRIEWSWSEGNYKTRLQNKPKQHTLKGNGLLRTATALILCICRAASIGKDSLVSQGRAPAAQDITACGWRPPEVGILGYLGVWSAVFKNVQECSRMFKIESFHVFPYVLP
jgi:hypothetical protein